MDKCDELKLDIDWILGRVERLEKLVDYILSELERLEKEINIKVRLDEIYQELNEIRMSLRHE